MMYRSVLVLLVLILGSCATKQLPIVKYDRQELKQRTFNYFLDALDNKGQVLDRYPTVTFTSIAATGFGLSSYIVGIENKYISRKEGAKMVKKALEELWKLPEGPEAKGKSAYKGFYYHFLTPNDVVRYKNVELSSVDTGLLMAGVLSCMTYFDANDDTEKAIRDLADKLYKRIDWQWMMKSNGIMSMGWHPESGFIESEWAGYNEAMFLLVMAMGSPTHPIAAESWSKWCATYDLNTFYNYKNVQFDPLFGHQYSHIWIDFRGIQDSFMRAHNDDYFNNSVKATLANRAYCIDNPKKWKGYGKNQWGLSACDGPKDTAMIVDGIRRSFFSYRARGAASFQIVDDGTITPTAAGGSFPFTPVESEACLSHLWNSYYHQLVGKYGFKDAFNLTYRDKNHPNGWFDKDYLGIDQGAILLQIQNHENGLIWNIMKKNPYIVAGLKKAGFNGGWLDKTQ